MFLSMTEVDDHTVYIVGQAPSSRIVISDNVAIVEAALIWDRASQFDIRVGDVIRNRA